MKHLVCFCLRISLFICFLSLSISCEKDYAEIGTDIVDSQSIEILNQNYPAKTYNKLVEPFQSNGLTNNLLGYYYDPNFGGTTAHFVGQLTPTAYNPDFGDNTILDSVVLTIPYYNKFDGEEYTLDSLYGGGAIKLSIFKNNFFLRDFDPGSDLDQSQAFYSNGALSESEFINTSELEGQLLYSINEFIPSNAPIDLKIINDEGENEISETLTPCLRLKLDDSNLLPEGFWESLIFNQEGSDVLSSANNFFNYFRGLYFKVEPLDGSVGNIIQLNFGQTNAHLKLFYTYDSTSVTTDVTTTRQGVYEMGFNGKKISLFENNFEAEVLQSIINADIEQGDDQLFIKGGEGAMAVVELFSEDEAGNTFYDFITDFRDVINPGEADEERIIKRLINEAYLEFYIDESALEIDTDAPNRIFVYDLKNNIPIIDYILDSSINSNTGDSKFLHLVPLTVETDEQGNESRKYKVRLTAHLNNIIENDSTNLRLGVVTSSNVGLASAQKLLNYDPIVKGIPIGSILSPKGVILHGSGSNDPVKQVKLNVYYSQIAN